MVTNRKKCLSSRGDNSWTRGSWDLKIASCKTSTCDECFYKVSRLLKENWRRSSRHKFTTLCVHRRTDRRTDTRTDARTDRLIPVYPQQEGRWPWVAHLRKKLHYLGMSMQPQKKRFSLIQSDNIWNNPPPLCSSPGHYLFKLFP